MPGYRVTEAILTLSCFDVVGRDSDVKRFVGHAGLASSAGKQNAAMIPVLDMGPPMHDYDAREHLKGDVVGSAVLTDDEQQKIRTFVDRNANEHAAFSQLNMRQIIAAAPEMYCVLPHASPLCESDGRYARTRFSCAGFVLEAYKRARIELLDIDAIPNVNMEIIMAAYPQARLIESGAISAEALGLGGNGPWPVLLCGYLFHALNREPDVIRQDAYSPSIEDRYFP